MSWNVPLLLLGVILGCGRSDPALPLAAVPAAPVAPPPVRTKPSPVVSSPALAPREPAPLRSIEALPDPKTVPDSPTGRVNGDFAPELALLELQTKKPWRLSAHVGPRASLPTKVVVLSFSASWCGPCRLSLPFLKQMEDQFGSELEVVIVTMDEDAAGKQKEIDAVRAAGLEAPILEATPEVLTAWLGKRRNIPHLYILNRAGEVMVQDRGFGDKVRKVLPGQIRYAQAHPEYVPRSGG